MKPLLLMTLPLLALVGCQTLEQEIVLPGVDSSPGASWGTRQFSVTPTSHRYEISGDYRISLEVTYEASYRFDGGAFQSLPGHITRSGGEKVVEVLSVTPVLVDRGCHSETLVAGRC